MKSYVALLIGWTDLAKEVHITLVFFFCVYSDSSRFAEWLIRANETPMPLRKMLLNGDTLERIFLPFTLSLDILS